MLTTDANLLGMSEKSLTDRLAGVWQGLISLLTAPIRWLDELLGMENRVYGRLAMLAILFPIFASGLYAYSEAASEAWLNYKIFAIMLLVSGAGFFSGAIAGFIFGIPRVLSGTPVQLNQDGAAGTALRPTLRTNSNLEQVSDWVTTIIIGLTLINAKSVLHSLHTGGKLLSKSIIGKETETLSVFAPSAGVYTFLVGFLCFYILTRTKLTLLFKQVEDDINDSPLMRTASEELALLEDGKVFTEDGTPIANSDSIRKVAGLPLSDIRGKNNTLAWARANKQEGIVHSTINGYQRAITLDPDDLAVRLEYAKYLAKQYRVSEALNVLSNAESVVANGSKTLIQLARVYVLLYSSSDGGLREAKAIATRLKAAFDKDENLTSEKRKAQVWFYLASVNGRLHKSAEASRKKKLREEALEAVKNSVSHYRARLREIWNKNDTKKDSRENDLQDFYDDEEFIQLLGEPGDQH